MCGQSWQLLGAEGKVARLIFYTKKYAVQEEFVNTITL
jgi:hypothetical protein